MRSFHLLIAALLLWGCGMSPTEDTDPVCPSFPIRYGADWKIHPTTVTPGGRNVDPTGNDVDPVLIDAILDSVNACVEDLYGNPPRVEDIDAAAQCHENAFRPFPCEGGCTTIKVVDDWEPSCDGTDQVLPLIAGDDGCVDKGLNPTDSCPCHWRAATQDDGNTLVVTPNLRLLADVYVRSQGCRNPWAEGLSACVSPTGLDPAATAPTFAGYQIQTNTP